MNKEILNQDILSFADNFKLYDCLRDKRIAITGATGLLGSCMAKCLLALDKKRDLCMKITCVVRNEKKARSMFGEDVDIIKHDFCSSQPLALQERTDFVVHFASPTASRFFISNPVETIKTGIYGTEQVIKAAMEANSKSVVYVSSLEVYGTVYDDTTPLTEDRMGYLDPMQTRSSYPMAKRASECLCAAYYSEYGLPVKIARLAQTFGAGVSYEDNRVFAQFAKSVINNEDIILHTKGELKRCYCYTTDAIEGILYTMLRGKDGEAYNIANENTYISIADMARLVCLNFNPKLKTVIQPQDGLGYSPVTKLRLSCDKLRATGWCPRHDLKDMFNRLIMSLK